MDKGLTSYVLGYLVALPLALTSMISVASFLYEASVSVPLIAACSFSCFILNLILFWQASPSIYQSIHQIFQAPSRKSTLAALMTISACVLLYAFSLYSFLSLKMAYPLLGLLIPTAMIQTTCILSSIGFFGLYIDDAKKIVGGNSDPDSQSTKRFYTPNNIGMLTLCSISIYILHIFKSGLWPIPLLFLLGHSLLLSKKPYPNLMPLLAGIASILLCLLGYGSSLNVLYSAGGSFLYRSFLKISSAIGMGTLIICDIGYSISCIDTFKNQSIKPLYSTYTGIIFSGLILLNAIANSQISSAGSGFFCVPAVLGFWMSSTVMVVSILELMGSNKDIPPMTKNPHNAWGILITNLALITGYSAWAMHYRPCAWQYLCTLLTSTFCGARLSTLLASAGIGLHTILYQVNHTKAKQLIPNPEGPLKDHLKDTPSHRERSGLPNKLATA